MKRTRPHRHLAAFLAALGLLAALCFPSCSSTRPGVPDARANAELQAPRAGVDVPSRDSATAQNMPVKKPGLIARIFQKTASEYEEKKPSDSRAFINPTSIPRKCKGCQFVIQNGNGNTSAQSATGKKAQSATGDGAKVAVAGKNSTQATDSAAALNTGGGAAAVGAGARAEGGAVKPEAPGFWATIAKPLGYVGAAAAVAVGLYLLYLIWAFIPRRKTNNQA